MSKLAFAIISIKFKAKYVGFDSETRVSFLERVTDGPHIIQIATLNVSFFYYSFVCFSLWTLRSVLYFQQPLNIWEKSLGKFSPMLISSRFIYFLFCGNAASHSSLYQIGIGILYDTQELKQKIGVEATSCVELQTLLPRLGLSDTQVSLKNAVRFGLGEVFEKHIACQVFAHVNAKFTSIFQP